MDYIESWLERQNRLDALVRTDDYKNWLVDFVDKYNGFSDDSFLYSDNVEEKTKEYSKVLSYFFSMVEKLAKEQMATCEGFDYDMTYFFKLQNNYYEINTLCGQGTITSIRKVEYDDNINYALLDEEIDEDELENRKLIEVFIFNNDLKLSDNERFETIVNLTLSSIPDVLSNCYSIDEIENHEHLFLKCNSVSLNKIKEENECYSIYNDGNEIVALALKYLPKRTIKEIIKDCISF